MVDVIVGNEEDLQKSLGIPGPEVSVTSNVDSRGLLDVIERVLARYPNLRAVATTLRHVASANRHQWTAVALVDGKPCFAPVCELDVFDRVGAGDGFAAGFVYGLLVGETPEQAVRLGWSHGALLTTFPGDTTMATLEQVRAFASGGSARIQR
jgi:2-dehydro-3-deoxygluconokinase